MFSYLIDILNCFFVIFLKIIFILKTPHPCSHKIRLIILRGIDPYLHYYIYIFRSKVLFLGARDSTPLTLTIINQEKKKLYSFLMIAMALILVSQLSNYYYYFIIFFKKKGLKSDNQGA
jgi:hypothetical protein